MLTHHQRFEQSGIQSSLIPTVLGIGRDNRLSHHRASASFGLGQSAIELSTVR
ncbi:MAG: hypothetical protein ACKN85_09600 [Pirellula sp.]